MIGTALDTVVLQYFLLTGRFELLMSLLSPPLVVPRIVYDPEEVGPLGWASSELARAVAYEERIARSANEPDDERRTAQTNSTRLRALAGWVEAGDVVVGDLSDEEWALLEEIRAAPSQPGRLLSLGMGESACLALALGRGYTLATDDAIALRVLEEHSPGHPYERIRKLLIRAADEQRISPAEANDIHSQMRRLGFWDNTPPFADP